MTPERDRQISALFHAARELSAGQRVAFLAQACDGDEALRTEVEALLAGDERAGNFLKQPVVAVAAGWFADQAVLSGSLTAGLSLGRYRILSRLGAGGMGEVYLAEDTQLDRKVAVKLLPAEFTAQPERVRRFIREAKAASALNHPNILTIHEIGQLQTEAGSLHFIVTEYVDGQTLRASMAAGRMPLSAALDVAIQAAGALNAAHDAGIIHRDIKPENLMLRPDGYVKLLDFGLAKLAEKDSPASLSESESNAPASPKRTTEPGAVMGTAHYMSPEQARGIEADARTDVFSLGVVLYEMIAGRAPFDGVNAIEVMGAILNREPAPLRPYLASLDPAQAGELERIAAKALCKERDERYQASKDLLLDLRKLKGESGAFDVVSGAKISFGEGARAKRRRAPLLAASLLAAIAAIGATAYYTLDRSPARPPARLNIVPFASLPGREGEPDFSPDGNQLAFTWDGGEGGQTDVYVKMIGAGTPLRLTHDPADEISPVWSPDGRHIAFIRIGKTENQVLLVTALGGPERKLLSGSRNIARLTWSPDGRWLAMADAQEARNNQQIMMVSIETGEKRPLTTPPASSNDFRPAFSPDGRQLAFVRDWDLYLTAVNGDGEKRLTTGSRGIDGLAWSADGREIIFDSGRSGNRDLWRVPATGGEPEALFSGGSIYSLPAISKQGRRLAFIETYLDSNIRRLELPATAPTSDRTGRGVAINWEAMTRLINSQREDDSPQFSPDGKKIAFASNRTGSMELWVCPSDGGSPLQLTHMVTHTGSPRWSPDGRHLVYDSQQEMQGDLFVIDAEGGAPRRLTAEPAADILPSWSRDGTWVYFCSNRGGDRQIWKMPASGGQAVKLTRKGGFEAVEAPDGKTIYYSKARGASGLWTVPATGGEEHPVPELAQAGFWRSWAMTDNGIYFVANAGASPPRPLNFFNFATRRVTQIGTVDRDPLWYVSGLAVSPDGRWLLYAQDDRNTSSIMLVEDFQ
ncbi:MAG: LpqB family beta-propeller domain-containing protein [Blastocatellales bacterium]